MSHMRVPANIRLFVVAALVLVSALASAQMEWKQVTHTAAWASRWGNVPAVVFDGKMWVLGGINYAVAMTDVYYSTDGFGWTRTTDSAPWSAASGRHCEAITFNGKIWVLQSARDSFYFPLVEVWNSADGAAWTRVADAPSMGDRFTALAYGGKMWALCDGGGVWSSTDGVEWIDVGTAAWGQRPNHHSVVFDNKMWVLGGRRDTTDLNDVWYSTDGVSWTLATDSTGWVRMSQFPVVTHDGKMWVLGGTNVDGFPVGHVWWSADGVNWARATDSAGWGRRAVGAVLAYNGHIWVVDGYDVWRSADGVAWTKVTFGAEWEARTSPKGLAFDGKMWVLGGYGADTIATAQLLGDVWHTTDGVAWTQAVDSAPWAGRYDQAAVVFDNRMWIMGGFTWGHDCLNDVWSSYDGVSWVKVTDHAAWPGRARHTAVAFGGRMWVMGGRKIDGNDARDVWYSTDGANWTRATSAAGWSGRNGHAAVTAGGYLWVLGGWGDGGELADVWRSADGVNWTQTTANPGWSNRTAHSATTYGGRIWVCGGAGGATTPVHDVWYSTDGVSWTQATAAAEWSRRANAASVGFGGKLWVLGGWVGDAFANDVWYYEAPPGVEVVSPNGGEVLFAGTHRTVTWASTGSMTDSVSYSLDNGTTWRFLGKQSPPEWYLDWVVPDTAAQCLIKVTALGDSVMEDVSDAPFAISPGWRRGKSIPVLPNGNERKGPKDGAWLVTGPGPGKSGDVVYVAKGNKTTDFYRYEPAPGDSSAWYYDGVAQIPLIEPNGKEKAPGKGCVGVYGGGYIYMTKGANTDGFWRYNVAANTWEALAPVPLGWTGKKVKGGTDMVYVAGGGDTAWVYLLKGYKTEFYRYDVKAGRWETLSDVPAGGGRAKWDKGSFLVYDGAGSIYAHQAKYVTRTGDAASDHHYMFRFDLAGQQWAETLPGMPLQGLHNGSIKNKKSKDGGSGVWRDGYLYALKGGGSQQFFQYDPRARAWLELDTIPSNTNPAKKTFVKAGGDITVYEGRTGTTFFILKGNKTFDFLELPLGGGGKALAAGRARSGIQAGPAATAVGRVAVTPSLLTTGSATLRYSLPAAGPATIKVIDVTGRQVLSQAFAAQRSGRLRLDLDGLSNGVYLVRLESERFNSTAKMVIER